MTNSISNAEAERFYRESMMNDDAERLSRASLTNAAGSFTSVGNLARRVSGYTRPASDIISEPYRHQMLAMRLRLSEGEKFPFDDIHTSLGKEKVFVFVVQNDQAVTLEDDPLMFPSDLLITQLRLIAK